MDEILNDVIRILIMINDMEEDEKAKEIRYAIYQLGLIKDANLGIELSDDYLRLARHFLK